MRFVGLLTLAALLTQTAPAFAQYHYSWGNSKVTQMNQTGLFHPSATYIGAGTLSQSAQGKSAGVGGELPAVNFGSHVRTPGDNIYDNDGTDRLSNGALVYDDQKEAMMRAAYAKARAARNRAMWLQRSAVQEEQQGHAYVLGSNGAANSYGAAQQRPMIYSGTGAATYGGYGYQPGVRP